MAHHRTDQIPTEWSRLFRPGRRIVAIEHDCGARYHGQAYLKFDDGELLEATAAEHNLAPLFDCFTLTVEPVSSSPHEEGTSIGDFEIQEAFALIRDEWLMPAPHLVGRTIGNNPHEQFHGRPGCAPAAAVASSTMLGGVLVTSREGHQLAVTASLEVPLNVDVIQDRDEIERILATHSRLRIE